MEATGVMLQTKFKDAVSNSLQLLILLLKLELI